MVIQSKQLRANAAKVHSALSWDKTSWVKTLLGMWKVMIPTKSNNIFVEYNGYEILYVCVHVFIDIHTQRHVSCSWWGVGGGARTHMGVRTQERQSNFYSKLGLTITVWLRYTVKLVHSYYYKLSNFSQKMKWSYPHMGFTVEPTTETERALQLPVQYQRISFWKEECQPRCHADSEVTSWKNGILWCIKYKNRTHFCPISCDWH